jgi:hypothetical protein
MHERELRTYDMNSGASFPNFTDTIKQFHFYKLTVPQSVKNLPLPVKPTAR